MLLNASHEVTNCGLPPEIQERYVRYKQGNRAIVAWMTKYGPDHLKGKKTLPIKQMIALGRSLCTKAHEIGALPPDVDFYFEEVIKERTYLSTHYRTQRDRGDDDLTNTVNHQHFTESLRQIHEILLKVGKPATKYAAKMSQQRHKQHSSRTSSSSLSRASDGFSLLSLSNDAATVADESDEDCISDVDTDATSECSHDDRGVCCDRSDDNDDADFLDTEGHLGVAVEAVMFVEKLQHFANVIETVWKKAGTGDLRLPAGAAYTNVILGKVDQYVRTHVDEESRMLSPRELRSRIQSLSSSRYSNHVSLQSEPQELLDTLDHIFTFLCGSRSDLLANEEQQRRQGAASEDGKPALVFSLMQDMHDGSHIPTIASQGLHHLQGQNGSFVAGSQTLATCIRIYFLATSHRAFSSGLPNPRHIALPRLSALRLAQEATSCVDLFLHDKSIVPCQCINTLGYRIAEMRTELINFTKHKCWNTLMQSPLTAGNHVLEILDLCSFYGMRLFHYRQYTAAVLHCYHALAQLQYADKASALEEVCNTFSTVLYPNSIRPSGGFMACWLRYVGARLRFRQGKKYQDHKDTWCMAVPAHAAATSAGLNISGKEEAGQIQPKFDYGTIDELTRLKRRAWSLYGDAAVAFEADLWSTRCSQSTGGLSCSATSAQPQHLRKIKHKRTKSCHVANSNPAADTCHKLEHIFNASLTIHEDGNRRLPTGKINLLSFFYSMTRVVSGISDATHANDDKSSSKTGSGRPSGRGQMCLCFVQTILRAADRIQDIRKRHGIAAAGATLSKGERECVDCFKKCLASMLVEAQVLDGQGGTWLWQSI